MTIEAEPMTSSHRTWNYVAVKLLKIIISVLQDQNLVSRVYTVLINRNQYYILWVSILLKRFLNPYPYLVVEKSKEQPCFNKFSRLT